MSWNTRGCVRGTAPAGQGDLEVVAVAFQQRLVGGHRRVERDVEQPHVSVFGLDLERSDREAVGLQAKRAAEIAEHPSRALGPIGSSASSR